jgi:hypothetical protein
VVFILSQHIYEVLRTFVWYLWVCLMPPGPCGSSYTSISDTLKARVIPWEKNPRTSTSPCSSMRSMRRHLYRPVGVHPEEATLVALAEAAAAVVLQRLRVPVQPAGHDRGMATHEDRLHGTRPSPPQPCPCSPQCPPRVHAYNNRCREALKSPQPGLHCRVNLICVQLLEVHQFISTFPSISTVRVVDMSTVVLKN